ncbi:MAG: MAPEG family protein, partial [Octadecabacter sp.]
LQLLNDTTSVCRKGRLQFAAASFMFWAPQQGNTGMLTGLYAALIAAIFIGLSARVIAYRLTHRLSLGDHGNKSLMKRMRAQANCAEYAPFGLLLMALVELQDAASSALHIIGLLLLAGRALHAYGFSASPPVMMMRQSGMMLTFASYLVSIFCLLVFALIFS